LCRVTLIQKINATLWSTPHHLKFGNFHYHQTWECEYSNWYLYKILNKNICLKKVNWLFVIVGPTKSIDWRLCLMPWNSQFKHLRKVGQKILAPPSSFNIWKLQLSQNMNDAWVAIDFSTNSCDLEKSRDKKYLFENS